jgi:hypothetical protein
MFKPWTAPIIQSYPVQSFTTSDLSKKLHRPSLCSKSSEASYTIRFPKVSQRKRSSYEPRAEIEANFASFAFILREFISANHNIHWSSHTIIIHVVFPIWSQGYRWCMLMLVSKCLKYMSIYVSVSPFFTDFYCLQYTLCYIYIYVINICFPMCIQRIENPAAAVPAQRTQGSPSAATGWEACGDRHLWPRPWRQWDIVGLGWVQCWVPHTIWVRVNTYRYI